jgi:hypothetical protein
MSVSARVSELKRKHETLSQTVEKAQQSPGINDIDIKALKKQKLRLKEEITRLSSG